MSEERLSCPECGGEMQWEGYRPLFPTCSDCRETFHIEDCERS